MLWEDGRKRIILMEGIFERLCEEFGPWRWIFNDAEDSSELKDKEEGLLGRRNRGNLEKEVGEHSECFRNI